LILQPDINTKGHTQWYYFAVSNTRKGQVHWVALLLRLASLHRALLCIRMERHHMPVACCIVQRCFAHCTRPAVLCSRTRSTSSTC
jgi:hypothetical protein